MALIAQVARMARSTTRSTPHRGDHGMPATERYRRRVFDMPGLWQASNVVDLDRPLFLIDRVEDAVAPGPQVPQIRRTVRERFRRPRLIGQQAVGVPGAATPTGSSRRKPAAWSRAWISQLT
jgi:hypothetical protein